LFKDLGDELDEERVVKSATGVRNTTVWKKLFKFRDHTNYQYHRPVASMRGVAGQIVATWK